MEETRRAFSEESRRGRQGVGELSYEVGRDGARTLVIDRVAE